MGVAAAPPQVAAKQTGRPRRSARLRAGRDLGVLSRPSEPVERAAESVAEGGRLGDSGPSAASMLRYATVTPTQQRIEQLDPATLVDRIVAGVLRSLRGDPADRSGRVVRQLGMLSVDVRSDVLGRLAVRLPSPDYQRVVECAGELDPSGVDVSPDTGQVVAGRAPQPVPDVQAPGAVAPAGWPATVSQPVRVPGDESAAQSA